ncbi:MAG: phosphoribosylformylglycinamidine synthase subunit PurQ [Chloroflexi bacterium]|nr:phosphoribosylformylglycinamidine synthase subunit PurQ [Chloroflexota bacterium]
MTVAARMPRVAVAVFPGTWSERDFVHVVESVLGWEARLVWHTEADLGTPDAVVLPGGFAHGDHLRTGAIARFSPIMRSVEAFAAAGGPVIGSCNGFQVLTEAGMLPGALLRNDRLEFRCDWQSLRVEHPAATPAWLGDLADGDVISLPISHGEGRYIADTETLDALERDGRVVLRYTDADGRVSPDSNPNGSDRGIAGIVNERGNVLGLMPHPERASESEVGGTDGLRLFRSLDRWLREQPAAPERRLSSG